MLKQKKEGEKNNKGRYESYMCTFSQNFRYLDCCHQEKVRFSLRVWKRLDVFASVWIPVFCTFVPFRCCVFRYRGIYVEEGRRSLSHLAKVRETVLAGTRLWSESRRHTNHRFSGAITSLVDLLTQQLEVPIKTNRSFKASERTCDALVRTTDSYK